MHRFLALSPQYEPLINGAVAFVSVLLILRSYYRLGGAGALLGCVLSAAVWFAFRVAAKFIFVFAVVGGSAIVQESTFVSFGLLLSAVIFVITFANNSREGHTSETVQADCIYSAKVNKHCLWPRK
jgi:hypothetical protein